jgi:hypothetical protein
MSTPVLLSASYQTKQFSTAYGSVVWSALKNPPGTGTDAYELAVARAQDKGTVAPSSRANYVNVSRHADWLRDFYDNASIYVPQA